MRSALKTLLEFCLVSSGFAHMKRRRLAGRVLVVAFHNVVPDDAQPSGDRPNHLPLSRFAELIDELSATHDVVPLADTLAMAPAATARPRVAITFDDAYAGAVRLAMPELARRRLPATIFVAPAFIGGRAFWWDSLADSSGRGLEPIARQHVLTALAGDSDAAMQWAASERRVIAAVSAVLRAASLDELREAASLPGITLASHSWSHSNLAALDAARLVDELERPRAWLEQFTPNVLNWLAYPYGMFNDAVASAARTAGYDAALAIDGGWYPDPRTSDRYALPRLNVPHQLSRRGLALRAAGLLLG